MGWILTALVVLLTAASTTADVRLPALFSDHMVLQRSRPIPVWGWGTPGKIVSVRLGTQRGQVTVQADSTWRLTLSPMQAGGPHELVVDGDGRLIVSDVLVGEVWIGSGQSNMQWTVANSDNAATEIAAADQPDIRLFQVPRTTASVPQTDVAAAWQVCSPASVADFSAVAYFFGRRLHQDLQVPIGLIHSSWGGTRIEPWTDMASLQRLVPALPDAMGGSLTRLMARAAASQPPDMQAYQASVARMRSAEADSVGVVQVAPDFDDSGWSIMQIPAQWEQAGLPGFDGMVWFRRIIHIPADWAGRDLDLHLGPVDETDVTWFDGERIGATGSFADGVTHHWDKARRYRIPGRLVRPGPRVLVVRAIDTAFAGGLWGFEAGDMYLAVAGGDGQRLALAGDWRYLPTVQLAPAPNTGQGLPAALYHAMIHPLIPYAVRGVIWYQGEANLADGAAYTDKMEALINGWRRLWGQPLAFYFAQLAPYWYGGDAQRLPRLWEAQSDVLDRVRNTGMAVLTDVGDLEDIHPRNKQTVGDRLALWALARTYGRGVDYAGPRYLGMVVEDQQLTLRFEHARGLRSADGAPLTWFEIAGADGLFHKATAVIRGTSVVVSSPEVTAPVAARFAWYEGAEPNLVNGAGLPAVPFRTHRPKTR